MFTKYSTLAILATLMLSACQAPMPHNNQLRLSTNHAPKNSVALENAAAKVLTTGLEAPWDMALGEDGFLWVTERQGKKITRVNTKTGQKYPVITIDEVFVGPQHEGILGLTLSPNFSQDNTLYTAYTYKDGENEHAKIVRLLYNPVTKTATVAGTVIDKLPANNDHNAGRLRLGHDGKLYYTIGDMEHNQGSNKQKPIQSQQIPTQQQIIDKDWHLYAGKTLRLNTDGSIPQDNPTINGIKSHIFTYGHRNPQGLVFVGDKLFSVEHGPNTDDEINLLQSGGNYGWPMVAGFVDNQAYEYTNHSENAEPKKETNWQSKQIDPLKTFYTVNGNYQFKDSTCKDSAYICWPTIAPASVTYYPKTGSHTYWQNSLIISSLKNGSLYVVRLKGDQSNIQGDVGRYFHTQNRYRHTVVSPDGKTLYVATDVAGNVVGANGKPTKDLANPGAILQFDLQGN